MKEFEDAMLDIGWKNLDSEYDFFKDMDTKAIGIITITGILITFLPKPTVPNSISSLLFYLTTVSFMVTIFLCILVIRSRNVKGLLTKDIIEQLRDETPEKKIQRTIDTLSDLQDSLYNEGTKPKSKELKWAIRALGLSVFLLIIYSISTFIFPVPV